MTRISKALAQLPRRPHALYRFYDRTDVLLYVGITASLSSRVATHKRDKPWWVEVRNITIEHYDTREEALDAEAAAIRTEKPLYNNTYNELVQAPEQVPEVVTWTPHGPRTGPITVQWIEANWQRVPGNVRDRVEVPAYDQGRRELAEDILDWYTADEVAELRIEGRRAAEDDGDEFPYGVSEDDAYIAGRAALAAFASRYEDAHRLEVALDHLMSRLPNEVREPVMARAEYDVKSNGGAEYTDLDVKCWGLYCLAYAIAEGAVAISLVEKEPSTDSRAPVPDPTCDQDST